MYKNVLLAVDLEDRGSWQKALVVAEDQVRASGGVLHILTVVPDFGMSIVGQYFPKNYEKDVAAKIMAALKDFVKAHVSNDIKVQHIVGEGTVYEVILNMARDTKADLIVVAAGREGLKEFLLGPNAARVVRHATCSVLVVRD